jgi:lipoprotein-anchoring transpeptidase ErfK/SrfK
MVGLALVGTTSCSSGAKWLKPGETEPANAADVSNAPKISIDGITDGATDVRASTEIAYTVTGASGANGATVSLVDDAGKAVAGAPRTDGSSWVPDAQLEYGKKYTATVAASAADGTKGQAKANFTVMAKPANLVDIHSWIADDQVVGVGLPIVASFGLDVPAAKRADVQKRLFVQSDPPQEGIWNWINPHEVHFRPRDYWKVGTKLSVRFATGGLAWGVKDWYGREDLTVKATVGADQRISVDNKTKQMTVTKNGQVVKTAPVSLGKPASPSSSGKLLIMDRNPWSWFDSSTFGLPVTDPGGYRTKVDWTMRLTWDGQFIHAAPWSLKDQGKRNVSHGCVNVATDTAHWLYDFVKVGDPVTVVGTETHVPWGDGWTDWDRSWDEYVKGSAIPYQANQAGTSTGATPSGSGG